MNLHSDFHLLNASLSDTPSFRYVSRCCSSRSEGCLRKGLRITLWRTRVIGHDIDVGSCVLVRD